MSAFAVFVSTFLGAPARSSDPGVILADRAEVVHLSSAAASRPRSRVSGGRDLHVGILGTRRETASLISSAGHEYDDSDDFEEQLSRPAVGIRSGVHLVL